MPMQWPTYKVISDDKVIGSGVDCFGAYYIVKSLTRHPEQKKDCTIIRESDQAEIDMVDLYAEMHEKRHFLRARNRLKDGARACRWSSYLLALTALITAIVLVFQNRAFEGLVVLLGGVVTASLLLGIGALCSGMRELIDPTAEEEEE